jgi:hypothetical protein
MKIVARFMMILGLLFIVAFLFPSWQNRTLENGTEERFTLGLPHSPWFLYTTTNTKIEVKSKGVFSSSTDFSWSNKMEFISWSSPLLIAGIALLITSRRLLKRSKG